MIEREILEAIVVGRAEPQIYAFTGRRRSPTLLKVGDTYRPVDVRLDEWRKYFPQLAEVLRASAQVGEDSYFRDYAVHRFLEYERGHARLTPETFSNLSYYSNEFFQGASKKEVEEAIDDIEKEFDKNGSKYQFYKLGTKHDKVEYVYSGSKKEYEPRPRQQATIERFREAIQVGRNNLLMYAVIRHSSFVIHLRVLCCENGSQERSNCIRKGRCQG